MRPVDGVPVVFVPSLAFPGKGGGLRGNSLPCVSLVPTSGSPRAADSGAQSTGQATAAAPNPV